MNGKRILEAVIAGVAVWIVVEWTKSKASGTATPTSYTTAGTNQTQDLFA